MKKKEKPNGHTEIGPEPAPVQPVQEFGPEKVRYYGKRYNYYKTLPWAEFWDEFNSATGEGGRLKYKTAWAFAKAKGRNPWQREVIYQCIGPKPKSFDNGKTIEQPWLGDWQKRRSNNFAWALADPANLTSIKAVIKERKDALEAARALGPISAKMIARLLRVAEKVDEAFNGEPFLAKYAPDHKVNKCRFERYMDMHKQVNEMIKDASAQWLKAYGLDESRPEQWLAMIGAAATGAVLGNAVSPQLPQQITDQPNDADIMLARYMIRKAEMYRLEGGSRHTTVTIDAEEDDEEKPDTRKAN